MMRAPLLAVLFCACTASPPEIQAPDAATSGGSLSAPALNAPPTTSAATLGLRGSARGASMVVVQTGGPTNAVGIVLPDGTFCVDVPLAAGPNRLQVVVLANGQMSPPATVTVVQDATSTVRTPTCVPPPTGETACTGAEAACDPSCNGCHEDAYQPNFSPAQAPALNMKTSYPDLQLCPCRDDWFTFVVFAGQNVVITTTFSSSGGFAADLALYRGGDVLPQLTGGPVATGVSGTSGGKATRTLTFTASAAGAYYLRIAAPSGSAQGSYVLATQ